MTTSMSCLIPGLPCTLVDLDAIKAELLAEMQKTGRDERFVLVMSVNSVFGLISLSSAPTIGPLHASLSGVRKAATMEEAEAWSETCAKAGTPPLVPLPIWAWRAQMLHYITLVRSAVKAATEAGLIVDEALKNAASQTKH